MKVITIGRGSDNNVIIADSAVSKHHVQLVADDSGIQVIDLESTNGTFVNGERIKGAVKIESGDEIRIGNSVLPWEKYLQAHTDPPQSSKSKRKLLLWSIIGAAAVVGIAITVCLTMFNGNDDAEQQRIEASIAEYQKILDDLDSRLAQAQNDTKAELEEQKRDTEQKLKKEQVKLADRKESDKKKGNTATQPQTKPEQPDTIPPATAPKQSEQQTTGQTSPASNNNQQQGAGQPANDVTGGGAPANNSASASTSNNSGSTPTSTSNANDNDAEEIKGLKKEIIGLLVDSDNITKLTTTAYANGEPKGYMAKQLASELSTLGISIKPDEIKSTKIAKQYIEQLKKKINEQQSVDKLKSIKDAIVRALNMANRFTFQ